jgi:pimeloyl-ACP methyl ester carboxylesterase
MFRVVLRAPVRTLAGVATAAALLGGCAYLDTKQRELIFRPTRDAHWTPADQGLAFEDLRLPVVEADGRIERVHAWWIPAVDPSAPALLYLHGSRWSLSGNVFRIARLHRMGFAVLALDYRGFGASDGELPSEEHAYADAQAAWAHLRSREPEPARRFVYGHSLGGAVAIELARRNADVAGVIVESSFTSIRDMADALGYGNVPLGPLLTQRFESSAKVAEVGAPILFVHGASDRYVPPAMSEALHAAARAPKALLIVPDAGHSNATGVGYERYAATVREFFGLARLGARPRSDGPRREACAPLDAGERC